MQQKNIHKAILSINIQSLSHLSLGHAGETGHMTSHRTALEYTANTTMNPSTFRGYMRPSK